VKCRTGVSGAALQASVSALVIKIWQHMRIQIQDCQTRKYLQGPNQWVGDRLAATNFSNSMEAFRHCISQGLAGVNIIVDFGDRRTPLIIPFDRSRQIEPVRAVMA
jgi:hypothetical protein